MIHLSKQNLCQDWRAELRTALGTRFWRTIEKEGQGRIGGKGLVSRKVNAVTWRFCRNLVFILSFICRDSKTLRNNSCKQLKCPLKLAIRKLISSVSSYRNEYYVTGRKRSGELPRCLGQL